MSVLGRFKPASVAHTALLLCGLSVGAANVSSQTDQDLYLDTVDPVFQSKCTVCHAPGGAAENGGARLILGAAKVANYQRFTDYLNLGDVSAQLVLQKVIGEASHGGGRVLTKGGKDYAAIEDYLVLTLGVDTGGGGEPAADFWAGTALEPRETTLRRAALLLAGKIPGPTMVTLSKKSDAALRGRLMALMNGPGFKDFLITGANDRLHTDGLRRGVEFNFDYVGRFPEHSKQRVQYPEREPDDFYETYQPRPYLTRWDLEEGMRWGLVREPLELIAHVVMTNQSYKRILTANYTMVNKFSNVGYRSGIKALAGEPAAEDGTWDRRDANIFRRGTNKGYIFHDDRFRSDEETWEVSSHSGFQNWPHAGILSTPAWLARYPSTDTNRNRARARWTYYHFLDVDIEKSAPRSTDPDALADTNNPTMNNPACTVCHERMDPVAGTYQSFGDQGEYKSAWGGTDSLAESYKYPEWYGGKFGDTPYREGDTWYRDMRTPGFDGAVHSGDKDSLQWLGVRVANDKRFARATVKFWWPAVFGAEALKPPEDPGLPNYDQRLRAYNAQSALIDDLAASFTASGFKLKGLLADMVMSPWFRTSTVDDTEAALERSVELATVGSGRLLTPEELDRKNLAVFGRTWGTGWQDKAHWYETDSWLRPEHWNSVSTFYGGVDSAAVVDRNRDMTPLMSNVAEKMALDMSCQVVLNEFRQPKAKRHVFKRVEPNMDPASIAARTLTLTRASNIGQNGSGAAVRTIPFNSAGGELKIKISDVSPDACRQISDDEWRCSHLQINEVAVLKNGATVKKISGSSFETSNAVAVDEYFDDYEQQWFPRGWFDDWRKSYSLHTNAWMTITWDIPKGSYELRVKVGGDLPRDHHNDAVTADVRVTTDTVNFASANAKAVLAQMDTLYASATSRKLSTQDKRALVQALSDYASAEASKSSWYEGHCDTWNVWNNESQTQEEADAVWSDPAGMKRAWTMVMHQLMTSFWYLHD